MNYKQLSYNSNKLCNTTDTEIHSLILQLSHNSNILCNVIADSYPYKQLWKIIYGDIVLQNSIAVDLYYIIDLMMYRQYAIQVHTSK